MKCFLVLITVVFLTGCPAAEEKDTIDNYEIKLVKKSNVVIDCKDGKYNNGKLTELRIVTSRDQIPENVIVRNCTINGAIRVAGLGMNGESKGVNKSSKKEGHTKRAQEAAPKNIVLENLKINGDARIPVYLSPGANNVILRNSKITGKSNSVAIYLDAESGHNKIIDNTIDVNTGQSREVIAVDGSANNTIANNKILNAKNGGIYLYRNCGEGGTVRHQSPQNNVIKNNSFNLNGISFGDYGIWLGSRNGNRSYCEDDRGYPFGSSIDNGDFADFNTVKNNSFTGSSRTVRNDGKKNKVE